MTHIGPEEFVNGRATALTRYIVLGLLALLATIGAACAQPEPESGGAASSAPVVMMRLGMGRGASSRQALVRAHCRSKSAQDNWMPSLTSSAQRERIPRDIGSGTGRSGAAA